METNLSKESQSSKILSHLKKGNSINPMEALVKFGCFRLAARISDLRSLGHNIKTEMVINNKKNYANYILEK